MTTLREYFDTEQKALNAERPWLLKHETGVEVEILCKLSYQLDNKLKYFSLFFPKECDFNAIKFILDTDEIGNGKIDEYENMQEVRFLDNPESVKLDECTFVKNIFVYIDRVIDESEKNILLEYGKKIGFSIILRDKNYAVESNDLAVPLAFISHDFRDKDELVRELAQELYSLNCPVWYDEYSLKAGDNMRECFEKGIKEAKKCIVILSSNYLSNDGWAKTEFETILMRELHKKENILIPVWHNVDTEKIYDYSPQLLNRFGLSTKNGIKSLAKDLASLL
ncbi:MAG TPA: hypothetical protein CFH82_01140 [Sulfurospirillum sp. UBA12182]|nr:MAG TPA: hypothetical protein CFH82_01140 [Sulfurospirillum sp. UBA12182]